jgi:iron complex outermembrane receptor protein
MDLNDRFELTPRVDANYTSEITFIAPGSVPLIEQSEYVVSNVSLTLTNTEARWHLTAGVLNLLDERYLLQGNASLATLGYAETIYARPRNWFVQLSFDF